MLLAHDEAAAVGLGAVDGLSKHIRPYRNGRDITQSPRNLLVIDLFGVSADDLKQLYPALYQHMLLKVKPVRDQQKDKDLREKWWLHRRNNEDLRNSLATLDRYIATVQTSKFRRFVFLDKEILPDDKLIAIASSDPWLLGVLSSTTHEYWALASGATLEDRPVYNKSSCFEAFPFPVCSVEQTEKIRTVAEQLDFHRKKQQAQYSTVTITGMYNVLEKLKTGEALNAKEKIIHEQGLVSVLKQLHDELDLAVLAAYGWSELAPLMQVVNGNMPAQNISPTASRDEIKRELEEALLEKLVALNSERAEDEKKGIIHWLRPEYQNPQGAMVVNDVDTQTELVIDEDADTPVVIATEKQPWPKGDLEQVKAVADVIATSKSPLNLDAVAACFSGKGQWKKRLPNILDMLVVVGKARVDERGYVAV